MLSRGPYRPKWLVPGAIAILSLTVSSCGGDGGGLTFPPTTGTLQVTATTTGDEQDSDGFTVKLDAEAEQGLAPGAMLERTELQPGEHTVFLGGVSANCSVADNPRTVSITAGQTTAADFAVTCTATSGGIVVTTTTTGDTPDPDGFDVILDGGDQGVIPASGQLSLTGLAPGSHVVGLSGIAGNCQIQGDNLRTVTVTVGASATADYAIACTAPPSGAGTLRIITATSGSDQDANGYSVSVDGGDARPIGRNATETVSNLAPGAHTVRLSDVASNCRLQGANPRSATVPSGGSVDLTFTISCSPRTGTVQVSVSSSGQPADPNGYVVKLDGADPGQNVNANGSVRFDNVPVGAHTVALSDVASSCTADAASKPVTVTEGQSSPVSFTVTCSQATGSIVVTTQTGGDSPDADGYGIRIDGNDHGTVGSNGQQEVTGIAPGSHTVTLSGVAANCSIDGDDTPRVTVPSGGSVTAAFTITCATPPPEVGTIHVTTHTSGDEQDDQYQVAVDGGTPQNIGANDELSLSNVPVGSHSVELTGQASNCTVQGDNPQSATVTAGQTSTVEFNVVCSATTGSVTVRTNTTGDAIDPDGYSVSLDGGNAQAIGANDGTGVVFNQVPAGQHNVTLSGVADNCTVTSQNPADAPVVAGQDKEVDFTVTCSSPTGAIAINVETHNTDSPPDHYDLILDQESPVSIGPNDSHTFDTAAPGPHQVTLSGIPDGCSVPAGNPIQMSVTAGETSVGSFDVDCAPPAEGSTIARP